MVETTINPVTLREDFMNVNELINNSLTTLTPVIIEIVRKYSINLLNFDR